MQSSAKERFERETTGLVSQLEGYITQSIHQGYDTQEIKNFLTKQGYDQEIINEAIRQSSKNSFHNNLPLHHSHSIKPLVVLVVFLLAVATGAYFVFDKEELVFDIEVRTNDGTAVLFEITWDEPVIINYEILTENGLRVIAAQEEMYVAKEVMLPEDLPYGEYVVLVEVIDEKIEYKKELTFTIREPAIDVTDFTQQEMFTLTLETHRNCLSLTDLSLRDECFFAVSKLEEDGLICQEILDQNRREDCYVVHVLSGKSGYCEQVGSNRAVCQ